MFIMVVKEVNRRLKRLTKVGFGVGIKSLGRASKEAEKIKEAAERLKREVRKNVVTAITAAFGFMIAFVWRDAIKESIDKILAAIGLTTEAYFFRILSAILITIIAVIGIMFFSRWAEKKES